MTWLFWGAGAVFVCLGLDCLMAVDVRIAKGVAMVVCGTGLWTMARGRNRR